MQTVTAFVKSDSGLRQCPGTAVVTLVDALARGSAPVLMVQTEDGVAAKVPLQECTHCTLAGPMLHFFDGSAAAAALLFRATEQAVAFSERVRKHLKVLGQGGVDMDAVLEKAGANETVPNSIKTQEEQIREVLQDPSFPEFVDFVEKVLCRMIHRQ